jgi:nicotinamidase-related amidase
MGALCSSEKVGVQTGPQVEHDEAHCVEHCSSHPQLLKSSRSVTNWEEIIKKDLQSAELFTEHQKMLDDAGAQYVSLKTGFTAGDCLLIIDMQNDFLPAEAAPDGGKFGVAEGAATVPAIETMTRAAAKAGALIVATRDYHPDDHCSFLSSGGHFPAHCVQGSKGSFLYPPVKEVLKSVQADGADVRIVFKGFHPCCDSFGGVGYGPKYFEDRQLGGDKTTPTTVVNGCAALDWTGSFGLKCSNIQEDLDAPPDVLAVYQKESLADMLKNKSIQRVFVCGLALDFCVLDSALNAASGKVVPAGGVYFVVDAARAAHIPGIGTFGTGFLSDPKDVVGKCKAAKVNLVRYGEI